MIFDNHDTTLFASIYRIAETFLDFVLSFMQDFLFEPFPYTHQIIEWMDALELAELFPDFYQFFIWAEYYEWSTGIVMLFASVTVWILFRIYLFVFNSVLSLVK